MYLGDFVEVSDESSRSGFSMGQVVELYQDAAVSQTAHGLACCNNGFDLPATMLLRGLDVAGGAAVPGCSGEPADLHVLVHSVLQHDECGPAPR